MCPLSITGPASCRWRVAVWEIPPGTKYVNGGTMTVDHTGRIHVVVRGEEGLPVYFQRDPATRKWTRQKSATSGVLVAGHGDSLYLVSDDGLRRTSASHFDEPVALVNGQGAFFKDSQMGLDRTRFAHDGWVSVIGQNGKTVTVVDYWIGDANK